MADSWGEYFYGSDATREADRLRRQAEYDATVDSPAYQTLRRLGDTPLEIDGRTYDPRELRYAKVLDTLHPSANSEYARDLSTVPGKAYSMVFETTMRPRDTLIKASQALADGDGWKAAELAARAPVSMVYPPAAAGTPDSPDDWRADARKLGVSPSNVMAIDLLTDPETYLATPMPFLAAGRLGRAVKPAIRFGSKVPPHLADEAAEAIRRLRSSPQGAY